AVAGQKKPAAPVLRRAKGALAAGGALEGLHHHAGAQDGLAELRGSLSGAVILLDNTVGQKRRGDGKVRPAIAQEVKRGVEVGGHLHFQRDVKQVLLGVGRVQPQKAPQVLRAPNNLVVGRVQGNGSQRNTRKRGQVVALEISARKLHNIARNVQQPAQLPRPVVVPRHAGGHGIVGAPGAVAGLDFDFYLARIGNSGGRR
nr:hypothetical protein [Tanacetum cinerariifolium]